jgi:hypothetical protein
MATGGSQFWRSVLRSTRRIADWMCQESLPRRPRPNLRVASANRARPAAAVLYHSALTLTLPHRDGSILWRTGIIPIGVDVDSSSSSCPACPASEGWRDRGLVLMGAIIHAGQPKHRSTPLPSWPAFGGMTVRGVRPPRFIPGRIPNADGYRHDRRGEPAGAGAALIPNSRFAALGAGSPM